MSSQIIISIGRIYSVATILAAMALAAAFLLGETDPETANLAARYTARVSFLMFVVVIVTGPAARIWRGGIWSQFARRRRHLGLAFAALMLVHLIALGVNVAMFNPRPLLEMLAGGAIYAFIAALAITSNDWSQRRMGKWWRRLHWIGVTVILLTFLRSYGSRLFEAEYFVVGAVFTPIAVGALLVRILAALRKLRS